MRPLTKISGKRDVWRWVNAPNNQASMRPLTKISGKRTIRSAANFACLSLLQ